VIVSSLLLQMGVCNSHQVTQSDEELFRKLYGSETVLYSQNELHALLTGTLALEKLASPLLAMIAAYADAWPRDLVGFQHNPVRIYSSTSELNSDDSGRDQHFRLQLLVCGEERTGKTELCQRSFAVANALSDTKGAAALHIANLQFGDDRLVAQIWDCPFSSYDFPSNAVKWTNMTHERGMLVVFDVANRATVNEAVWSTLLKKYNDGYSMRFVLCGNHVRHDGHSKSRVVGIQEGVTLARKCQFHSYVECDIEKPDTVRMAFLQLCELVRAEAWSVGNAIWL